MSTNFESRNTNSKATSKSILLLILQSNSKSNSLIWVRRGLFIDVERVRSSNSMLAIHTTCVSFDQSSALGLNPDASLYSWPLDLIVLTHSHTDHWHGSPAMSESSRNQCNCTKTPLIVVKLVLGNSRVHVEQ